MKILRSALVVLPVVALLSIVLDGAQAIRGTIDKASCGGFKPETDSLCWRNLP